MKFQNKIVKDISSSNIHLLRSFFPKNEYSYNINKIRNFKKFKNIIVIGMGGSILASKAIYSFLKHKIKKKFVFIDNLDQNFLKGILKEKKLSKSLFLIISKSGNTNETIINTSYFKSIFNKSNTIIISENKNNILAKFAKSNGFCFIKHNPYIGGRYSVFSEVGMLPAYLMGLNPISFKKNLPNFLKSKKNISNSLKQISKINNKKIKILILINYIPELNDFLFWCQQLLAESLGKNKKGFIPVVSNAPKDHHSLLQLYLDGPKDKIFYVFSTKDKKKFKINCNSFGKKISYLNKKNYQDIIIAQKKAFIEILKKNKTPFREIFVKRFNEDVLGRLFLLFIFETIALGRAMKINPFDQPAVEKVKVLTKKFLNSNNSSKKNL